MSYWVGSGLGVGWEWGWDWFSCLPALKLIVSLACGVRGARTCCAFVLGLHCTLYFVCVFVSAIRIATLRLRLSGVLGNGG